MQMLLNSQPQENSGCLTAVAPVIAGGKVLFDSTVAGQQGATAQTLSTVATGAKSPLGGTIGLSGCLGALISVDFITGGGDCDECIDDVLTIETQTFLMEKSSTYEIPPAFWKSVRVQLVDDNGAPADLTGDKTSKVVLHSGYKPSCADCIVIAP